jgi:hypothetical protein
MTTTTIEINGAASAAPEARFTASNKRPGTWLVRVPGADDLTGRCVEVLRKDGARVPVVLTKMLAAGTGEKPGLYSFTYGHGKSS